MKLQFYIVFGARFCANGVCLQIVAEPAYFLVDMNQNSASRRSAPHCKASSLLCMKMHSRLLVARKTTQRYEDRSRAPWSTYFQGGFMCPHSPQKHDTQRGPGLELCFIMVQKRYSGCVCRVLVHTRTPCAEG